MSSIKQNKPGRQKVKITIINSTNSDLAPLCLLHLYNKLKNNAKIVC